MTICEPFSFDAELNTADGCVMPLARRAVFDGVLPDDIFVDLSSWASSIVKGEAGYDGFAESNAWKYIEPYVTQILGPVVLTAAFFVETLSNMAGSRPHYDHGCHSAVLHLNVQWDLGWGGDFFFVNEDHQTIDQAVEFRPNRMVVWDKDCLHMHRPPTANCSEKHRIVLVMRFKDAV